MVHEDEYKFPDRTLVEQSCNKDVASGDMQVKGFMENVISLASFKTL